MSLSAQSISICGHDLKFSAYKNNYKWLGNNMFYERMWENVKLALVAGSICGFLTFWCMFYMHTEQKDSSQTHTSQGDWWESVEGWLRRHDKLDCAD